MFLTVDVDTTLLNLKGAGVDLAHVAASIRLLDLLDAQLPRTLTVVRDADAGIVRDHTCVQAQDRLVFGSHPCHLKQETLLGHLWGGVEHIKKLCFFPSDIGSVLNFGSEVERVMKIHQHNVALLVV